MNTTKKTLIAIGEMNNTLSNTKAMISHLEATEESSEKYMKIAYYKGRKDSLIDSLKILKRL